MGYGMAAVFLDNIGWRWAFYIQAILLCPSMIGLVLIPFEYFDVQGTSRKMKEIRLKEKKLSANVEALVDDISPVGQLE
jgi:MFS family permease